MATYWENSCSFGLRYVSWYKCLIVSLVFSHLGFWRGNLFLIAPFPDLCLLAPLYLLPLLVQILHIDRICHLQKYSSVQNILIGQGGTLTYKKVKVTEWPPIGKIAAHSAYEVFSWCKCLIVSLVFSHLGFWSGSLFLIAPFPDFLISAPRVLHCREAYSICESRSLIHQDVYHDLFVCS